MDAETPRRVEAGAPLARLLVTLGVAGFASSFAGRSADPLIGVISRDLASPPTTVALLSAAFALPYALVQPFLGPVGDALGKERVMTTCLAVLTLALAACAFVTDVRLLFALRMLAGGAAGGVIPLVLAMIGDAVPMERRQVAIGRFLVVTISGQLLGSTLAGLIEGGVGWRGVFAVTAGVAAAGFLAAVIGFSARLRTAGGRFDLATALARYRAILGNPRARVLFSAVFVEAIAVFGVFPFLAPLIERRGEGGPREAGLVLAGFAVGGVLYSFLVSVLLRLLGVPGMLRVGGLVAAGALTTVGLAGAWQLDAAALVVLGLGFYMLHNTYQVQVTEVAPTARGSAVALHAFSFFCGQAVSVAILGLALERLGQFGALAGAAALIAALGLVTAVLLGPSYPAGRQA